MQDRDKVPLLWLKEVLGVDKVVVNEYISKEEALLKVKSEVLKCRKCPLHRTKKNYVFGEGNPYAPIMFVGEAPGRDEDVQGIPFVGKAGQLLSQILEELGLKRGVDTYIANVLKCRPPKNRDPLPAEIRACSPYLDLQIKIINPKVLCALGRFAAGFLLNLQNPRIGVLRGKVLKSRYNIPLVVTYHPAAIIRNVLRLDDFREDIKRVIGVLKNER